MTRKKIRIKANVTFSVAVIALLAGQTLAFSMSRPTWGQILIAGESGSFLVPWSGVELYDPSSNSFRSSRPWTPQIYGQVHGGSAASLIVTGPNAGKVLISGGGIQLSNFTPLSSTYLYDPATNSFSSGLEMKFARAGHTATVIPMSANAGNNAGKVLLAGGGYEKTTEIYDPMANTFTTGPTMGTGRDGHTSTVIPAGTNAGKILIAGGYNGTDLASTEIYNPANNSFEAGPTMNIGRSFDTTTVIATGQSGAKILIVGGSIKNRLTSTELYDPLTNTFARATDTASMNVGRYDHAASVITTGPNVGKILIVGGVGHDNLSSTELYDPATNTFVSSGQTATMNSARDRPTATTILSGPNEEKILIAGGTNNNGPLSSTDLYDPVANSFEAPTRTPVMDNSIWKGAAIQLPPASSNAVTPP